METQQPHKRRVRYKGTHPRKYSEKYKELDPDKYRDTIEKVIAKGSTPAGMHLSICVREILDFLQIKPGQKGLDATFGYGGHSEKMLQCLGGQGHLYALDIDPIEIVKSKKRLNDLGYGEDILTVIHENFANIDQVAEKYGIEMLEYINEEGLAQGINPFDHGAAYTDIMKTQALKQALDKYGFTAAFGGGRRDEEKSRAKERIFSFRNPDHAWDPKNQRPEMWKLYNTEINRGESIRVFPISNWTEKDIWQYIRRENIDIVPLYFAAERPVVERDGNLIMVDDERMRLLPGEQPVMKKVRFRTLGCYPLSGGMESDADTLDAIIEETLSAVSSERTSRVIDKDGGSASMEKRKREGYF